MSELGGEEEDTYRKYSSTDLHETRESSEINALEPRKEGFEDQPFGREWSAKTTVILAPFATARNGTAWCVGRD